MNVSAKTPSFNEINTPETIRTQMTQEEEDELDDLLFSNQELPEEVKASVIHSLPYVQDNTNLSDSDSHHYSESSGDESDGREINRSSSDQ